jgi:hypothetical protein
MRKSSLLVLLRACALFLLFGTFILIWWHSWRLGIVCTGNWVVIRCIRRATRLVERGY